MFDHEEYELNKSQYAKMLDKIEAVLNREEQQIKELEKKKGGGVDIKEMGKVWEEQAKAKSGNEKVSKADIKQTKDNEDIEEMKRIGLKQFKTGNY